MTPDEYLQQRVEHQIAWYSQRSASCRRSFAWLSRTQLVMAALIPLAGVSVYWVEAPDILAPVVVGVLGVVVTIAAGLLSLGRYHEKWIEFRTTAENLKKERFLFRAGVEPYADEDAFKTLVQRVESQVSKENTDWSQYMVQSKSSGEVKA